MKILFVGTFEEKYSTHHSIIREFVKRNHTVIKFDFRQLPLEYMRIKHPLYKKYKNDF